MDQPELPKSDDQKPQGSTSGTTFASVIWTRKINYIAKEGTDRYPRRHMYEFTTIDTVRPEHRVAIALLDATNVDDGMVKLKDVGEKIVTSSTKEIIYNITTTFSCAPSTE